MRFELTLMTDETVTIKDKFKPYRGLWISDNTDVSIRKGIEHFYVQDAIDSYMNDSQQNLYVEGMMNKLPEEDLSFKEVKDIE